MSIQNVTDEDIQLMTYSYELNLLAISLSPKYKEYLHMEDELKNIENMIGGSISVLQQNELKKQYETLKLSILNFIRTY